MSRPRENRVLLGGCLAFAILLLALAIIFARGSESLRALGILVVGVALIAGSDGLGYMFGRMAFYLNETTAYWIFRGAFLTIGVFFAVYAVTIWL